MQAGSFRWAPIIGRSSSTSPMGTNPYSGLALIRSTTFAAILPLPTINIGALRTSRRKPRRRATIHSNRPAGTSTAAHIQTRATALPTLPSEPSTPDLNTSPLSISIAASAAIASSMGSSSRKLRFNERRYSEPIADSATTVGAKKHTIHAGGSS